MICKNCAQEVPEQSACPICGAATGWCDPSISGKKHGILMMIFCILGITLSISILLPVIFSLTTNITTLRLLVLHVSGIASFILLWLKMPRKTVIYPVAMIFSTIIYSIQTFSESGVFVIPASSFPYLIGEVVVTLMSMVLLVYAIWHNAPKRLYWIVLALELVKLLPALVLMSGWGSVLLSPMQFFIAAHLCTKSSNKAA